MTGAGMPLSELVYGGPDIEATIKKRFPQAAFKDASGYIRTEQFGVTIEGVTKDDFYPWAIVDGYAHLCLRFCLMMQIGESSKQKIRDWLVEAKAIKEKP